MADLMKGPIKYKDEKKTNPLVRWPVLGEQAFSHFSEYSYNEASLSKILRSAGISKGSFYFQFYDKMDLYLCLLEQLGYKKTAFLETWIKETARQDGIFGKLKAIAAGSLIFARSEPRYNGFWKNFLNENEDIKKLVKTAFPEITADFMAPLIDEAIACGQLANSYRREFIHATINLYFNNMDYFVTADMTEPEILQRIDEVITFLENNLT